MNPELQADLLAALERPHRLGMIGGDLEEQLAHCASFSRVLTRVLAESAPAGSSRRLLAYDLGSGGGVPGVALAALHSDLAWTLVEMRTGRATEIERALLRLGLDAQVCTEPAQVLGHDDERREQANVVVARSFGPPSFTTECATGLLRVGGRLIVSEPPDSVPPDLAFHQSRRWPRAALHELGFDQLQVVVEGRHRFAVLHKRAGCRLAVPRLPPRSDRGWLPPNLT